MLRLTFSFSWIGVLSLYLLLKLPSGKLGPWFVLWSFFFLRLLFILINMPSCMECCSYVWVGAPSCYLQLLDCYKNICRAVGPSCATCLEPLVHCQFVASWSLFYRFYFGRCSSELTPLVPVPFSWGKCIYSMIDCTIILSPFLDVTEMSMFTISFLA